MKGVKSSGPEQSDAHSHDHGHDHGHSHEHDHKHECEEDHVHTAECGKCLLQCFVCLDSDIRMK